MNLTRKERRLIAAKMRHAVKIPEEKSPARVVVYPPGICPQCGRELVSVAPGGVFRRTHATSPEGKLFVVRWMPCGRCVTVKDSEVDDLHTRIFDWLKKEHAVRAVTLNG
mgnify:CR=1 FL=1